MTRNSNLPIVAIIGQPNVGKSSLFNRLSKNSSAIVSKIPHTTRDPIFANIEWGKKAFRLVDTAGLSSEKDPIILETIHQVYELADLSSLFILVLDGTLPISDSDRQAAKIALKSKKPVILAVNKADKIKAAQERSIYLKLGIKNILFISAISGMGSSNLLDEIVKIIPKVKPPKIDKQIKIAILGRPNVGKSSLINKLSGKKTSIVSQISGTTRDISFATINFKEQKLEFADTAGLRKKAKINDDIEYYSSVRALRAIEWANICLLLIDPDDPTTHQDQNIAGLITNSGKGLIIAVNKADLIEDEQSKDKIMSSITRRFAFCRWAPLIFISSLSGKNLSYLKRLILDINQHRGIKIATAKLNKIITEAIINKSPSGIKNIYPKINYITQTGTNPPQFSFFGSNSYKLHFSYKRYLENVIRKEYDLNGTPIELIFKEKH
ncbi:MAG: ribosome biogenesis GTPase Der [bacterium]|nr:ribosome biogenesis GTPase Der [bacterium]